jgi:hypothetical protein
MPLFMDHHRAVEGLTAEAVADAHRKDIKSRTTTGLSTTGTGSTRTLVRSSALRKLRTRKLRRQSTARRMVWSRT